MKIDDVRDYILGCPFLNEDALVGIDYLANEIIGYSITESASYNPVVRTFINGKQDCVFRFNLDAKLHWNEEIENNISNSEFFNNFSSWITINNNNRVFPSVESGIQVNEIYTTTNGYIYATNEDEAIYRISCEIKYTRNKLSNITSL